MRERVTLEFFVNGTHEPAPVRPEEVDLDFSPNGWERMFVQLAAKNPYFGKYYPVIRPRR